MKKILLLLLVFAFINTKAQDGTSLASKLEGLTQKGDYIVLELRLNKEDEFRTMEGGESSLARVAVYTGNKKGAEVVSKVFNGMNDFVGMLNNLKRNSWQLIDSYSISGESLLITHYILERKK